MARFRLLSSDSLSSAENNGNSHGIPMSTYHPSQPTTSRSRYYLSSSSITEESFYTCLSKESTSQTSKYYTCDDTSTPSISATRTNAAAAIPETQNKSPQPLPNHPIPKTLTIRTTTTQQHKQANKTTNSTGPTLRHTTRTPTDNSRTQHRLELCRQQLQTQKPNQTTYPKQPQRDGYNHRLNLHIHDEENLAGIQSPMLVTGTTENSTTISQPEPNHPTNLSEKETIDEVRRLVEGTSQKAVSAPSTSEVATDLFEAIRRFTNAARWKEHHRKKLIRAHNTLQSRKGLPQISENDDDIPIEDLYQPPTAAPKGLSTGLHPKYTSMNAPTGSHKLEACLQDIQCDLLQQLDEYMNTFKDTNPLSLAMKNLRSQLKMHPDLVIVPTDKTNSFLPMKRQHYEEQMLIHLSKHGKEITPDELTTATQNAYRFLSEIGPHLSKQEFSFLKEQIDSKAIPTPKLLIKDHKPRNPTNGTHPTRLIAPSQNFIAGFPKMGYIAIKKIFEAAECQHTKYLIEQSYHLKRNLEGLHLTAKNSTIASIDAKDYYPSVKFKLVKKAIEHFAKDLPEPGQTTINLALKMIQQGMNSTYLSFNGKYYLYDGDQQPDEKGLTIGGNESAWLSDVVGSYLFQNSQDLFHQTYYNGIYRDDGIVIFKGKWTAQHISNWMMEFQNRIDELTEGDYLQYTCEIWHDPTHQGPLTTPLNNNSKVTLDSNNNFPYLDMELYWNKDGKLETRVHLKPNQRLLYLNRASTHPSHCFRNIPLGVGQRLAKLTTMTNENMDAPLDSLYPAHYKALRKARLLDQSKPVPTLSQMMQFIHENESDPGLTPHQQRQKQRDTNRTLYFCVGKTAEWKIPIWVTIKKWAKHYGLSWMRISMSYHRFPNLRESFNADLKQKLNEGWTSRDFQNLECNCRDKAITGCNYTNMCRDRCIVYCVEDRLSKKLYVGSTQQHFKTRMRQHFKDVREYQQKGQTSDSYAKHFGYQLRGFRNPSNNLQRNTTLYSKIWQANPVTCVPTFGTSRCLLCNHEKLAIFNLYRKDPRRLINKRNEITAKCRHKPQFHRFVQASGQH